MIAIPPGFYGISKGTHVTSSRCARVAAYGVGRAGGAGGAGGALPAVGAGQRAVWADGVCVNECTDRSEARNRKALGAVGRLGADGRRRRRHAAFWVSFQTAFITLAKRALLRSFTPPSNHPSSDACLRGQVGSSAKCLPSKTNPGRMISNLKSSSLSTPTR